MSSGSSTGDKRPALEQLRFSKLSKTHPTPYIDPASSSSSIPSSRPLFGVPPAQSRDATTSSRYFQPPRDTILVPSSSPSNASPEDRPHQPCLPSSAHDAVSTPSAVHATYVNLSRLSPMNGHIAPNHGLHVSFRQARSGDDSLCEEMTDEGPPRKRTNYGPSDSSLTSPGSPEVQRLGQRRRKVNDADGLSTSSEDSTSDIHRLAPSHRLARGPRPDSHASPSADPPQTESEDPKLTRFLVTMPLHSPSRVRMAWQQVCGDVKRATILLSDPSWNPKPLAAVDLPTEGTGRVKEIDEATKAERAAAREKGKRSMIYANRSTMEDRSVLASTPPPTTPSIDLTASSPVTPMITQSRQKRSMKMIVGSESELERTDDDEGEDNKTDISSLTRTLDYFNTADSEALQELMGCTLTQASNVIEQRPFVSVDDLNAKLGQGKKKAGPHGISPRMVEDCVAMFEGYGAVDNILEDCERIGATLRRSIASWASTPDTGKDRTESTNLGNSEDGALSLLSLAPLKEQKAKDYLVTQPALLADDVQLKEYQLLGVNWLYLLYRKNLSCILADEMGLGKTIQVISFFAFLKERGNNGPHLVIVPSSTLENWCREFARFAPSISVQTYYAGKEERPQLRQTLLETQRNATANGKGWEVVITTYNLSQGDERDRKFFRRVQWDTCVFDEGHVLKNFQSQRYQALLRFGSRWRLLLTGTPLQNNLQELVSLMNFILPGRFAGALESLRAIFKVKGDSKVTLLSQERISRAKKMMTPFVLRRKKDQVLKDLPRKSERIEWCEMTDLQRSIYTDVLQRSHKTILEAGSAVSAPTSDLNGRSKLTRNKSAKSKNRQIENHTNVNVLMDLRKAASHPMLFRTLFTDQILTNITKQLMKEPNFKKRDVNFGFVKEDMEVMTDAELQVFCTTYKSTRRYLRPSSCYLEAGKVKALLQLLDQYTKEGRKVLIFSQFTQILDILQAILKQRDVKYLILTGSTAVDVRQSLVDEFTDDVSIPVFLLSTKAGGMGINLTAASVVIMFDQDFNPHNDRQAQDRAYRIGQKRDVEVVKLITRGTIEEDMMKLGETKLALDEAVAGDGYETIENGECTYEREMKETLMNVLRQQLANRHELAVGVIGGEKEIKVGLS